MQREEKNTRRIGAYYEEQAAQYLQSKGYTIIKRNYKTPYGEIDLIAKKPDLLVFCEVKFRSSDRYGTGLEAVKNSRELSNLPDIFAIGTVVQKNLLIDLM